MLEGIKYDMGKPRFELIPGRALCEVVEIYTMGAEKYGERNWEKGIAWGRIFGATMRHLWAWWWGEDVDTESGKSHLAHAAWGCLCLLEYRRIYPQGDDRSKSPPTPAANNLASASSPVRYAAVWGQRTNIPSLYDVAEKCEYGSCGVKP